MLVRAGFKSGQSRESGMCVRNSAELERSELPDTGVAN